MKAKPFLPVAPLMIEHRLIERMIEVMRRKAGQAEAAAPLMSLISTRRLTSSAPTPTVSTTARKRMSSSVTWRQSRLPMSTGS